MPDDFPSYDMRLCGIPILEKDEIETRNFLLNEEGVRCEFTLPEDGQVVLERIYESNLANDKQTQHVHEPFPLVDICIAATPEQRECLNTIEAPRFYYSHPGASGMSVSNQ